MTRSMYVCDVCDTTADGVGRAREGLPNGWEFITLRVVTPQGPRRIDKDLCSGCLKLPLTDLLVTLRAKQEKTA